MRIFLNKISVQIWFEKRQEFRYCEVSIYLDMIYSQKESATRLFHQTRHTPFSPQIVYRPNVNVLRDRRTRLLSFRWNAPPGATSCGFLFAAGSLRPRVQRHPVSFAKQEVYILEVAFIVVACITGKYERKRAKRRRSARHCLSLGDYKKRNLRGGCKDNGRWRCLVK